MPFPISSSLLDAIVLSIVAREDTYGYRITQDVRQVMGQIEEQAPLADPLKARAAAAAKLFQDWAEEKGLSLKLRKKPRA